MGKIRSADPEGRLDGFLMLKLKIQNNRYWHCWKNIIIRAKYQKQSDISLELWEKQSEIKLNRGYSDELMAIGSINS